MKDYRKAEQLRWERKNTELWWQGVYFYEALCDVSPVLHAFAKKGTRPTPYSKEPYPITKQAQEKKKERERDARLERLKLRLMRDSRRKK